MDENKLRTIVTEVVNKAVEPLKQMLMDPDTGLKRLNERVDANTTAVMELESTINGYGDMYKINDSNVRKVEKRLETVEKGAGVDVSPELHLEPLSQTL